MPPDSRHDKAFLTFSLGPVQTFIAAARTVRDLWSGSYLLSWLTFQATRPVRDAGRDAGGQFVFPALEGNPLLALEQGQRPKVAEMLAPCLPNRFTAIVDADKAEELAAKCADAFRKGWEEVCGKVHQRLAGLVEEKKIVHSASWDRLWKDQVDSFWEVRTTVLPWAACDAGALDRLVELPAAVAGAADRLYVGRMDLLGRLAEARRSVRHVPAYRATGEVPQKCTILGTYEQMGPALLKESRAFWEDFARKVRYRGTHTRANERLCAISLVKRFAWAAFFVDELRLRPEELRFDDTATEAARLWLTDPQYPEPIRPDEMRRECGDWSGQWLHWTRQDQAKDEDPVPGPVWEAIQQRKRHHPEPVPTYYAVLMMDGDDMGKWLRGEKGLALGQDLHQRLSKALTRFALRIAQQTVEYQHPGTLIYAGGDDVLALLPTRAALECARDLNQRYAENWGKDLSTPDGKTGTLSAGVAIVHFKEDLRFALHAARDAEKAAKAAGKDRLGITVCRRSGEHTAATLPWDLVPQLDELVQEFAKGISDRWTYRLRAELPTLAGVEVPKEAFPAETKRLLLRLEAEKKRKEAFCGKVLSFLASLSGGSRPRCEVDFLNLCQSASFLARGRDE
jgi:CRISPR-associated protein Cmr2